MSFTVGSKPGLYDYVRRQSSAGPRPLYLFTNFSNRTERVEISPDRKLRCAPMSSDTRFLRGIATILRLKSVGSRSPLERGERVFIMPERARREARVPGKLLHSGISIAPVTPNVMTICAPIFSLLFRTRSTLEIGEAANSARVATLREPGYSTRSSDTYCYAFSAQRARERESRSFLELQNSRLAEPHS